MKSMRFFQSMNPAKWTRQDVLVVIVVLAVVTALAISADLLATPVVGDTGVIVGKVPTSSLKGGDRLVEVRDAWPS